MDYGRYAILTLKTLGLYYPIVGIIVFSLAWAVYERFFGGD